MHVSQHLQRRWTSRYLEVVEDMGFFLAEILHQSFEEELNLSLTGREAFLLLGALEFADFRLEGKRECLE